MLAPHPLERMALRLAKKRSAEPRDWLDPLVELEQARARGLTLGWDERPEPGRNTYRQAYELTCQRALRRVASRLRQADMLALSRMVQTRAEELARTLDAAHGVRR